MLAEKSCKKCFVESLKCVLELPTAFNCSSSWKPRLTCVVQYWLKWGSFKKQIKKTYYCVWVKFEACQKTLKLTIFKNTCGSVIYL